MSERANEKPSVIIVDDKSMVADSLKDWLTWSGLGVDVVITPKGEAGIKSVADAKKYIPSMLENPGVIAIFIDNELGDGKGSDVVSIIKKHDHEGKIALISHSSGGMETDERSLYDYFIVKNSGTEQISQTILKILANGENA